MITKRTLVIAGLVFFLDGGEEKAGYIIWTIQLLFLVCSPLGKTARSAEIIKFPALLFPNIKG